LQIVFPHEEHIEVWSLSKQALVTRLVIGQNRQEMLKAGPLRKTVHAVAVAPWGVVGACADHRVRIWKLRANASDQLAR
jgi:hypothetical protein